MTTQTPQDLVAVQLEAAQASLFAATTALDTAQALLRLSAPDGAPGATEEEPEEVAVHYNDPVPGSLRHQVLTQPDDVVEVETMGQMS